jgi:hypothetical protein
MQGQTMPLAYRPRPISFLNYLNSLLLGLMLQISNIHAQEPESTDTPENTAEQNTSQTNNRLSEAPPYESRTMRDRTLIANTLQDESLWLETEYGKILALYRITEINSTYGVLVLLHAAEDPQHWPPTLENLRANLPRYGWETLALTLPRKTPPLVPARPSSSSSSLDNNSDGEELMDEKSETNANLEVGAASSSSSSPIARDLLITAYIEAALRYLGEKNLYNIVVLTDNSSAYLSLNTLLPKIKVNTKDHDTIDGPLQALIIANLQPQENSRKTELESIFSVPQLPVMDIFFAPHSTHQQAVRSRHKAAAMRQKMKDYQQFSVINQPLITETDPQSFLLGRVRGFIQKKASGVELQKSTGDQNADRNP